MSKTCSVEGCSNKYHAKGYCQKHYWQMKNYGHILERTTHDPNEIIEYEDYAEIVLYDKQHNEVARTIIDLEDVEKIKNYKWSRESAGYVISSTHIKLHRLIMDCPEDMFVDHVNHNRLDNRKQNLRTCTKQQNNWNKSTQHNNTSGFPGINMLPGGKYRVRITMNNRRMHIGCYNTLEEAIEARKQAEVEYFGEYAPNVDKE